VILEATFTGDRGWISRVRRQSFASENDLLETFSLNEDSRSAPPEVAVVETATLARDAFVEGVGAARLNSYRIAILDEGRSSGHGNASTGRTSMLG
jgi:hypothetical protein